MQQREDIINQRSLTVNPAEELLLCVDCIPGRNLEEDRRNSGGSQLDICVHIYILQEMSRGSPDFSAHLKADLVNDLSLHM